jgi:3'-phosphoadenosine 5'-phosphosulfate sulfotransferase (PAPS reductase)/FAD synthetase
MAKSMSLAISQDTKLTINVIMAMSSLDRGTVNVSTLDTGVEKNQFANVSDNIQCTYRRLCDRLSMQFIHTGIICLRLEAPLHGKVVVKGNTPSSKALYSCNHGYKLHGLQERQCQYDGIWQGDAPVCKSK